MDHFYAVILAGGKGERFWPLSTSKHPKQLLSLVGDSPLLTQAVDRLAGLIDVDRVLVITNADLVEATRETVPSLNPENIIGEPMGRDTAAAVALACALVKQADPEAAFCILTADHIIRDIDLFQSTLRESARVAKEQDALVTIGIQPTEPSTGFGYIESAELVDEADGLAFYKTLRFVEKPDTDTATRYIDSGNYYWNSGMFIWTVNTLEKAFEDFQPHLFKMMQRLAPCIGTDDFVPTLTMEYEELEKTSVDYAIMEKAKNILMVRGVFYWDDVGSWTALENHFEPTDAGNVVMGRCEAIDAHNNIVISDHRVTALIGVKDLVVVHAEGATLICPKDRAQDIKQMVKQLHAVGSYSECL